MIEPLTAMLKDIDGQPVMLLRTAKGKTVAAVYDEEYVDLFEWAARVTPYFSGIYKGVKHVNT